MSLNIREVLTPPSSGLGEWQEKQSSTLFIGNQNRGGTFILDSMDGEVFVSNPIQSVIISYAWGTEREEIVNNLDQSLPSRGITIIRDIRELGYKGSIKNFMEQIGEGNCVIAVSSDKYIRSQNCMSKPVEIAENKQFADRISPIILPDASIYGQPPAHQPAAHGSCGFSFQGGLQLGCQDPCLRQWR